MDAISTKLAEFANSLLDNTCPIDVQRKPDGSQDYCTFQYDAHCILFTVKARKVDGRWNILSVNTKPN